jgi:hypothetical protein
VGSGKWELGIDKGKLTRGIGGKVDRKEED